MVPSQSSTGSSRPRATRRRGDELVRAILDAALAETAEHGLGRVTMEGIARRAGTAKTSLYRRWSSAEDIVLAGLRQQQPVEQPSPAADDLRGDLVRALMLLYELVSQPDYQAVMPSVFAEAARRPDFHRRLYEEVYDPLGGRFTWIVLEHYAERGVIDRSRVTPVVADIGEALLMKYSVDHQGLPGRDYVEAIVDQVILPAVGLDPRAEEAAAR